VNKKAFHPAAQSLVVLAVLFAGSISFGQAADESKRITVEDLVALPSLGNPVLSPDGKQFALVRQGQIVLWPVDGGIATALTTTPGGKSDLSWSPDGKHLAFISQGSVWVVPAIGGQPKPLTSGPTGPGDPHVSADRAPRWSPSGKWILFQSGRQGQNDLYVASEDGKTINYLVTTELYDPRKYLGDLSVEESDGLAGGLFFPDPAWSPDGTKIAYTERSREFFSGKLKLITFDDERGRAKGLPAELYTAKPDRGGAWAIDKVAWSPDGQTLAFTLQDSGWDKIYRLAVSGGEPKQLTRGESEDFTPSYSPDGKSLAILSNRDSLEERHIWIVPLDGSAPHRLANLAAGVETEPQWSPDGRQIYFVRAAPLESPSLYVAAVSGDGEAHALIETLPPNFAALRAPSPEKVHFKGKDGLDLEGILYRPAGYKPGTRYPTIVWVHGGPEGQDTFNFSPWSLLLAQEGYLVFHPNYRGGSGYGEKFRNLNVEDSGGGEIQDVGAAVQYLVDQGIADPKRVGIWGTSHGATMVHFAVTKLCDVFAAAVSFGGVVDRATFNQRSNRNSAIRWEIKMGGTPAEKPASYRQADILPDVPKIKTPLLILYGEADPQVPPYESQQLITALKKNGKTYFAYSYPREMHEFVETEHRLDVYRKSLAFFRLYLQPVYGNSTISTDDSALLQK
jgi:dipeptidyl aminopeptidase/acylaminoacyl peptidase